jgi:hypothetical protein
MTAVKFFTRYNLSLISKLSCHKSSMKYYKRRARKTPLKQLHFFNRWFIVIIYRLNGITQRRLKRIAGLYPYEC